MKFSKLPKEKRNHLILVVLVTLVVLAGLGYGLIHLQYENLNRLAAKKVETEDKLRKMQDSIKKSDQLEAELAASKKTLSELETGMASGDLYSWVINTMRTFRSGYSVDIPQFSPSVTVGDMNLLPKFPYKQASLSVSGTAHYHDFGRFLADFENAFPHIRVINLDLKLNPDATVTEKEKLAFTMEIVTLVKTNP